MVRWDAGSSLARKLLLRGVAMTADVDLCLAFATTVVLTYALWCLDVLPRVRMFLFLVGFVCLAVALGMRQHDLFAAAPTKPTIPLALTKDAG